ncbi:MAG: ATP phosphoribosyltransferase [Dehalococcoidia bacterium]|jgi:ATP phosphoribosyltransferase
MKTKIALPKGRLMGKTAALLSRAGWGLDGYHEQARFYHIESKTMSQLSGRVFHEKDIPVQVAIGNYDLGICGSDWIEELLAKYPSSALMKVKNLIYGQGALYLSAAGADSLAAIRAKAGTIRIASEYPNLAEAFAIDMRLRRFSVFPLWGGAEVYPPESADLALVGAAEDFPFPELKPISRTLSISAFLIANRDSWKAKGLDKMVTSIEKALMPEKTAPKAKAAQRPPTGVVSYAKADKDMVRLALPDGHQQAPTQQLLEKAGIRLDDYPSEKGKRRPGIDLKGVSVKVIRPQDMPLQVANDNFDLAISGRDWLTEHLCQFPSSPVKELADLKLGWVKVVAVVRQERDIADIRDLSESESALPIRVASEYINIADRYARDRRLNRYRLIPTWGASEAFLPEDADLLIENTQTGRTLAEHNLKIIDTLFESTACLIGSTKRVSSPTKKKRMESITHTLRRAAEEL